jgi:hypothetical protein
MASGGAPGTGGSGGTGGAIVVPSCRAPEVEPSFLTVNDPNDASQPNLVNVATDTATAALVYLSASPGNPAAPLARVTSLDAWGPWPPELTTPATIRAAAGGGSVATSSMVAGPALSKHEVALLYRGGGGVQTQAQTLEIDGSSAMDIGGTQGGSPLFLTFGAQAGLVLFGVSANANDAFSFDVSVRTSNTGVNTFEDACSTSAIAADAFGHADGFIVAAATGTKLRANSQDKACTDHPDATSATQIWIAKATLSSVGNLKLDNTELVQADATVTRLRMARRSDGGWIAWSMDGIPTLSAGRVTDAGVIDPGFQLGGSGATLVPELFGLGALGDGALFALVNRADAANDVIDLVEIDPSGQVIWDVPVATGGTVDGPISVISAPTLDHALVAWRELPTASTTSVIRIARVDCLDTP